MKKKPKGPFFSLVCSLLCVFLFLYPEFFFFTYTNPESRKCYLARHQKYFFLAELCSGTCADYSTIHWYCTILHNNINLSNILCVDRIAAFSYKTLHRNSNGTETEQTDLSKKRVKQMTYLLSKEIVAINITTLNIYWKTMLDGNVHGKRTSLEI